MEHDGSGVSALLGLDGLSCAHSAARRGDRRVVVGGGDDGGSWLVPDMWSPRGWSWPPPGHGAGPADSRPAGGAGVGQAAVALPGAGLSDGDLVGGVRCHRSRAVLTERARAEIARRVGPGQQSVAQTARDFGVGWHTAMTAVRDHGQPRVDHLARFGAPAAIGLDETSFLAATATHPTLLVTGILDLDTGRLVDVLPARSARAVTDWLAAKPAPWRAGIRHVVIDPYQPYATAVAAPAPRRPPGGRPVPRDPPGQHGAG